MSLNLRRTYETGNDKKHHLQACDATGSLYGRDATAARKSFVFEEKGQRAQSPSKRYSSLYKKQSSIFHKLLSRSE